MGLYLLSSHKACDTGQIQSGLHILPVIVIGSEVRTWSKSAHPCCLLSLCNTRCSEFGLFCSTSSYEKSSHWRFCDFWGLSKICWAVQEKWSHHKTSGFVTYCYLHFAWNLLSSPLITPLIPRTTLKTHQEASKNKFQPRTWTEVFPIKGSFLFQKVILVETSVCCLISCQKQGKPSISRGHYHSSFWAGDKMNNIELCDLLILLEHCPHSWNQHPRQREQRFSTLVPGAQRLWYAAISVNLGFAGFGSARIAKVKLSKRSGINTTAITLSQLWVPPTS